MQILNYLFAIAMATSVSAAPAAGDAGLSIRQSTTCPFPAVCPFAVHFNCVASRRSACLGSGLQYCNDGHFGGPSAPCDNFCRAQAQRECGSMGCCPYSVPSECVGTRRSFCLGSNLPICQDGAVGGPSKPCDDWCRYQAIAECRSFGC